MVLLFARRSKHYKFNNIKMEQEEQARLEWWNKMETNQYI